MMELIIKNSIQKAEKPTMFSEGSQTDKVLFADLLTERPEFSLTSMHEIE
jgi:hypothetical protein